MTWGNPVYTYDTVNKISGSHPGNLRYGDLLFYGTKSKSSVTIDHTAIYLGQYYLSQGDTTYYMLENNGYAGNVKEGRKDGVKIVPFNTSLSSSLYLVHTSRIF